MIPVGTRMFIRKGLFSYNENDLCVVTRVAKRNYGYIIDFDAYSSKKGRVLKESFGITDLKQINRMFKISLFKQYSKQL